MKNNIPIFILTLSAENDGVDYVALVDAPAIRQDWVAMKEQPKVYALKLMDDEKRIVAGALMIPEIPIYRNSEKLGEHFVIFTKETIQQVNNKFHKLGNSSNVNEMHDPTKVVDGCYMIESYIIDSENGTPPPKGFESLQDGTWFAKYKIENDDVWSKVKSGEFRGFSVEGLFTYSDTPYEAEVAKFKKIKNNFKMTNNEFLVSLKQLIEDFGGPGSGRQAEGGDGSKIESGQSVKINDKVGGGTGVVVETNGPYVIIKTDSGNIAVHESDVTQHESDDEDMNQKMRTLFKNIKKTDLNELYLLLSSEHMKNLTAKELIKKAKLHFKEKQKFLEVKTKDGAIITIDGETPANGAAVRIGDAVAPDGEYVLEDGSNITVLGGVISEIESADAENAEDAEDTDGEMKKLLASMEDRLKALEAKNTEMEVANKLATEKVSASEIKMTAIEKENTELKQNAAQFKVQLKAVLDVVEEIANDESEEDNSTNIQFKKKEAKKTRLDKISEITSNLK